jgi:hypothetical protein
LFGVGGTVFEEYLAFDSHISILCSKISKSYQKTYSLYECRSEDLIFGIKMMLTIVLKFKNIFFQK